MSSDPLIEVIAEELFEDLFPMKPPLDEEAWREAIYADAEVAAAAARNYFAELIRKYAKEQHVHAGLGTDNTMCTPYRASGDRCDITAALLNIADIVGRPF